MGRSAHLKKTWKLVKTLCKKRKNRTVYIVDKILKKEIQSAGAMYLVSWEGFPKASDRTWEPGKRLKQDVPELVVAFEASQERKQKMLLSRAGEGYSRRAARNKPTPFKQIKRNKYTMGRPRMKKDDMFRCNCTDTGAGRCGGEDCLQRALQFECLKQTCSESCQNRRLQLSRFHKLTPFETTDGRGWGVKAGEDIPEGALVQEYVGEVVTMQECRDRSATQPPNTPSYFLQLNASMVIDASKMGSVARFINHSCCPNCHTEYWCVGVETRVGIYATKAITAGTEVTFDYNFKAFGKAQPCLCGEPSCRGNLTT